MHNKDGVKGDSGKAPIFQGLFQYFPRALKGVAEVSAYGARKYNLRYDDVNWARVDDGFNRYSDAMARHLLGEFIDGEVDLESGEAKVLHCLMVAWNALSRAELKLKEIEERKK